MLKYIGAAFILFAALLPPVELRKRLGRINAEYAFVVRLLSGISERLWDMRTVGDYIRSIDTEGVRHALESGQELISSPERVISRLSVSAELSQALSGYFLTLGRLERTAELSRTEKLLAMTSDEHRRVSERLAPSLRVCGAVCLAVSLTLVIILI